MTLFVFNAQTGKNFNSHTREGVTEPESAYTQTNIDFNSHTREGVTFNAFSRLPPSDFNSHTREGVTAQCEEYREYLKFQLTHP